MTIQEFKEQDKFCKENNTPEGPGCGECPAKNKEHCADALRHLCAAFTGARGEELERISRRLDREYGISLFNQLAIIEGFIEFET